MDHGNGDATGYLMPAYDDSSDGFMVFEHEAVGFDESQDWREFLLHRASLEDCFS
jgi:hypothetical protein